MEKTRKKILVVDDDQAFRALYKEFLDIFRYQPHFELSGNQAFKYLEQNSEVDAIITDYSMRDGNGLELIIKVRKLGFTGPIVMISSLVNLKQKVLEAGANSFLSKPFGYTELQDTLKELLGE